MASPWYTPTGAPVSDSEAESATIRAEFEDIETALDKLPNMTGNGDKPVVINAGGTALVSATASAFLALLASGGTISFSNLNLSGSGTLTFTGGMNNTPIGQSTAAAGAFTTLTASTSLALATGATVTGFSNDTALAGASQTESVTEYAVKTYVDNNVTGGTVVTSGTPVALDFARFTAANTIEGRSAAQARGDLGLVIGTNVQAEIGGASLTAATVATDDKLLIQDTSAADALKTVTVQSIVDLAGSLIRSARTSNTILGASDKGTYVDVTSGTFTQTLTEAATLGDGWWCYFGNSGTGDVTIDPNGSETISGLTSFVMYPGEIRLIQCDGSNFNSIVINAYRKSFLSSGTYTKPPGYKGHAGLLWSGGASGGRTNGVNNGQGGAGGGCIPFDIEESFISSTETVTIGVGGAAFTGVSDTGNVGSDSSFGTLVYCYAGDTTSSPGAGVLNGSDATFTDSTGNGYAGSGTGYQLWGGGTAQTDAIYGGAGGGNYPFGGPATNGGTSKFGGDGGDAGSTGNGQDGQQPAGGGGGTNTGTQSGAGGDGQMDIWGIV